MIDIIICFLIPLLGTTLGAAMVFFLKKEINPKVQKLLLGFASGVMFAASIWSLLQPAIEQYGKGSLSSWLVPAIGFLVGVGFLLLLDYLIPHVHMGNSEEGIKTSKLSRTFKMMLAVTLHNVPEGLSVGVIIAGALSGVLSKGSMYVLAIGIAIQNFPEGAIVSMPLKEEGLSKGKAFLLGMTSGIVEPIAGLVALVLTSIVSTVLPCILSFAAGVMIYVVVEDLIPEASRGEHSNLGTIGFAVGFVLMMALDIGLG